MSSKGEAIDTATKLSYETLEGGKTGATRKEMASSTQDVKEKRNLGVKHPDEGAREGGWRGRVVASLPYLALPCLALRLFKPLTAVV